MRSELARRLLIADQTTIEASGRPPKQRIANPDLSRKIWIDRRAALHEDLATDLRRLLQRRWRDRESLFVSRLTDRRKLQTQADQATEEPPLSSMPKRRRTRQEIPKWDLSGTLTML